MSLKPKIRTLINPVLNNNLLFEYSEFQFNNNKWLCTYVIVMYRPPYSAAYSTSVNTFCEEFSDYIGGILAKQNSVIITGDFNIHVNDRHDACKLAFDEFLDCLNLQQHVTCPTHQSGNTLDLFITKCTDKLLLSEPSENFYISYHCFVQTLLSRTKPKCTRESRKFFIKLTK